MQKKNALNLGSGSRIIKSTDNCRWINIDKYDFGQECVWDLQKGIPFETNSCDEVVLHHFIEHLPYRDELPILADVYRVLKPNGGITIHVPYAEWYMKKWLEAPDYEEYVNHGDEKDTRVDKWGYYLWVIYGSQRGEGRTHQNCYTVNRMKALLKHVGFVNARARVEQVFFPGFEQEENYDIVGEGYKPFNMSKNKG